MLEKPPQRATVGINQAHVEANAQHPERNSQHQQRISPSLSKHIPHITAPAIKPNHSRASSTQVEVCIFPILNTKMRRHHKRLKSRVFKPSKTSSSNPLPPDYPLVIQPSPHHQQPFSKQLGYPLSPNIPPKIPHSLSPFTSTIPKTLHVTCLQLRAVPLRYLLAQSPTLIIFDRRRACFNTKFSIYCLGST